MPPWLRGRPVVAAPPRSVSGAFSCLAGGAPVPEHHLGLVHREAHVLDRSQAGLGPDQAVDIVGAVTPAAHDMVMVAAGPALKTRGMPGRLDAAPPRPATSQKPR